MSWECILEKALKVAAVAFVGAIIGEIAGDVILGSTGNSELAQRAIDAQKKLATVEAKLVAYNAARNMNLS